VQKERAGPKAARSPWPPSELKNPVRWQGGVLVSRGEFLAVVPVPKWYYVQNSILLVKKLLTWIRKWMDGVTGDGLLCSRAAAEAVPQRLYCSHPGRVKSVYACPSAAIHPPTHLSAVRSAVCVYMRAHVVRVLVRVFVGSKLCVALWSFSGRSTLAHVWGCQGHNRNSVDRERRRTRGTFFHLFLFVGG